MTYQECIDEQICPICQRKSTVLKERTSCMLYVECEVCGDYHITRDIIDDHFETKEGKHDLSKLAAYLYYNNSKITSDILISEQYSIKDFFRITPDIVNNWYPKKFSEKIDLILLKLDELSSFNGDYVNVFTAIEQLMFCESVKSSGVREGYEDKVQIEFLETFLSTHKFIADLGNFTYQLLPEGLERVYELQTTASINKNVFVSMAFNEGTKETREAIREGVIKAGFSPEYIDEIIHNHQIMPEMFRLIRESRFLILEISDPNYGAYYEAGYALGLGKEVIICCKEDVFNKEYKTEEEKKYAKYLKPHFDIAQKQILVWKDSEDLIKKLYEWIKALF